MHAAADAAQAPYVLIRTADGVATLTLNRGDRFNPLSRAMIAALDAALDAVAQDRSARVVVLAAEGRGFCAGHDLKEMRAHPDLAWQREMFDACSRVMCKLTELPQPVVARVHGIATAAGCQLVSMCDLAVAADGARFALPGVNVGVFCTTPAVGVARNIARKRAMEMLLTGETIDAPTALAWGLVNRVVPPEQLLPEALALARQIAANPADGVVAYKQLLDHEADVPLGEALRIERAASIAANSGVTHGEIQARLDRLRRQGPPK